MAWAPIVAGGVMSLISGMMQGDKDSMQKFNTLTPEQKQFMMSEMNNLYKMQGAGGPMGQGMNVLQQYLNPQSDIYKNFEQPYMQEFQQQTIPNLAERFAGAGSQGGALSSSGFGQALSSAGANLQTNLAQMKSQMQNKAIQDIFGQYNNMANRSMGTAGFGYQQQGASPWQTGLASAGSGLMNAGFQGMASGWGGGNNSNPSYQAQYPLTSGYSNMFQTGQMT